MNWEFVWLFVFFSLVVGGVWWLLDPPRLFRKKPVIAPCEKNCDCDTKTSSDTTESTKSTLDFQETKKKNEEWLERFRQGKEITPFPWPPPPPKPTPGSYQVYQLDIKTAPPEKKAKPAAKRKPRKTVKSSTKPLEEVPTKNISLPPQKEENKSVAKKKKKAAPKKSKKKVEKPSKE